MVEGKRAAVKEVSGMERDEGGLGRPYSNLGIHRHLHVSGVLSIAPLYPPNDRYF